jgi:nicotinamide-nucleotide amidase
MNTLAPDLLALCEPLAHALRQRGWRLATAESCTGGLIAGVCTGLSGSSEWLDRGFVTYSNAAKVAQLGVPESLIALHGAVSEPVACAMAEGALRHSLAQVSVAVTGVAGPTGGSPDKPVGTVCVAWATPPSGLRVATYRFEGDRDAVRTATVRQALVGLLDGLES